MVTNLWAERRADPDDGCPPTATAFLRMCGGYCGGCLSPDSTNRYPTAASLASALRGAADLLDRRASAPPPAASPGSFARSPLLAFLLFGFLPHVVGSLVNVAYNHAAVSLSDAESDRFVGVTVGYNCCSTRCAWPGRWACSGRSHASSAPVHRIACLRHDLDRVRLRATRLGRWAAVLSAVGWFPGGGGVPLLLTDWAVGMNWARFGHFAVSFAVSGLIAMTYSFVGVQAVVVRGLLPRLMHPEQTAEQRQSGCRQNHARRGRCPAHRGGSATHGGGGAGGFAAGETDRRIPADW